MCKRCGGYFVVGQGGKLECNRCGHISGDISLLFRNRRGGPAARVMATKVVPEERLRST